MWPDFKPELLQRAFPRGSLLEGTEAALWQSLGQMPASQFETQKGKQVVVRQALKDLGLDWVATNSTPFRIAVGNLFGAAAKQHRSNSTTTSTFTNDRTTTTTTKRRKRAQTNRLADRLQIQDESVREIASLQGPLLGPHRDKNRGKLSCSFSTEQRQAVRHQLDTQGACVVRRAVPSRVAQTILARDCAMAEQQQQCIQSKARKTAKLAETTGNGVAGSPPSIYRDLPPAAEGSWRRELQDALWDLLLGTGSGNETAVVREKQSRKDILLEYGHSAQNWAHQDSNREQVPVQALLMLSDPRCDFEGGEFYVARRATQVASTTTPSDDNDNNNDDDDDDATNQIRIRRSIASLRNAGDLVLFQAGRETGWWHGMLPVRRPRHHQQPPSSTSKDHPGNGAANNDDVCYIRKAVGMLQPA